MTSRPSGPPLPPLPPLPQPHRQGDAAAAADLTDGTWHRLHPLTPLLRGGIALLVILGWVVNTLRERLLDLVIPGGARGGEQGDPIDYVVRHDYVGVALLGVLVFILVLIGLFTLSWRMHTFRVTGEVVEVRSGVLFRNHRKARLDRIQAVNVVRPFVARLVGTARLEISQAGNDANVQLAYLGSRPADDLRQRILLLASGARADVPGGSRASRPAGRFVDERMTEFLAPELDPAAVRATRVVRVHTGRLIGSVLLSNTTVVLALAAVGIIVSVAVTGQYFLLVTLFPAMIGAVGVTVRRFTKSLQYSIAATPDGIRIGYGLVSTSNETLPPGRIHAVAVTQPLLWRPFGWWDVRVNRASHAGGSRQNQQTSSVVLPVGDTADVRAVLEIILPELVGTAVAGPAASFASLQEGSAAAVDVVQGSLTGSGDAGGFTRSPGRGAWLRPLSWRRNGYRSVPGAVLLRLGAVWRSLVVVPLPRVQSIRVAQGPLERALGLAEVHVHTVHGPVVARIGALAVPDAMRLFSGTEAEAVRAAAADTSHRWRDDREARGADPASVTAPVGWEHVPRPDGGPR
ncbi:MULTISPECIES: PH domain-containing protein [unclassified Curtobacterium]|uniref:PH domain-containing protein n=1 Tax=unclassified Curtobacterium TaxID=257496 RepID=UPI0021ACD1C8|nr:MULTISPECIES: PH domain-containing protein [unclassified Curtobacterium]WIB63708.1 PH domain-containing protein [Curtobacterium sp. MCBD17_040]